MSERPVLVKICGIRTLEAAQTAVDAGADLLGFICYPAARRYLPPEQIAAILEKLRNRSSVQAVGVFVNQPVEEMNAVATLCGLDLLQLSGNEPSEWIRLLDRPVIKAFRPGGWGEVSHIYAALLEPPTAGWGGAGEQLDWSIARAITELAARPPVFLAGGLRPENVAQAIAAVRPDGVDVSSGVEVYGIQDCARIAAFVTAAKGVAT